MIRLKKERDKIFEKNIILTSKERIKLNNSSMQNCKNKNVLVIGGMGSGKTRNFVKPNIMQMNSSYVITDSKMEILNEYGSMLEQNGYEIKIFDTRGFLKSMQYNPFSYIKSEEDIETIIDIIILNTTGENFKRDSNYYIEAEKNLLKALVGYVFYNAQSNERNFDTLIELIDSMKVKNNYSCDEEYTHAVDLLFEEFEKKNPENYCVKRYRKFKLSSPGTANNIINSCSIRLSIFELEAIKKLTMIDELELDTFGVKKVALFIIKSDCDNTFDILFSLIVTQTLKLLCNKADEFGGRLPMHVRFLLDDFVYMGKIPNLGYWLSVLRDREISINLMIHSITQLKSLYKEQTELIIANCGVILFFGSNDIFTLNWISKIIGKDITAFKLLNNKCLCKVGTLEHFICSKFNIKKHKNYKYHSEYYKKNKKTEEINFEEFDFKAIEENRLKMEINEIK